MSCEQIPSGLLKNVILLKTKRNDTQISRIMLIINQDRPVLQSRFTGTQNV